MIFITDQTAFGDLDSTLLKMLATPKTLCLPVIATFEAPQALAVNSVTSPMGPEHKCKQHVRNFKSFLKSPHLSLFTMLLFLKFYCFVFVSPLCGPTEIWHISFTSLCSKLPAVSQQPYHLKKSIISLSNVRTQVSFGLPLFLLPSGFQYV